MKKRLFQSRAFAVAAALVLTVCCTVMVSALSVNTVHAAEVTQTEHFKANASLSEKAIKTGKLMLITSSPSGGTAPYSYSYFVRRPKSDTWESIDAYKDKKLLLYYPSAAGVYSVKAVMSDSAGNSGSKVLSFTAYEDTGKSLALNSAVSPRVSALGTVVTLKAKSTGGVLPVTYTYKVGKINGEYKTVLSKTTLDSLNYKPTEPGYYNLKVIATDYKNNTTEKTATFIVTNDTGATLGADVTAGSPASVDSYSEIKAAGKGGTAPYKYLYYYRQKGTTSWKQISADRYSGTARFSADYVGSYEVLTKTLDYNSKEYRNITSVSFYKDTGRDFINNSFISSKVITEGDSVTLNGRADGGALPYSYEYYYRINGSGWQLLKSGGTSFTYKPAASGEAEFRIIAKDAKNTALINTFSADIASRTKLKALKNTDIMPSPQWSVKGIGTITAGNYAAPIIRKGRWVKVQYGTVVGWVYNLTFESGSNYTAIDTTTLPAVIDDYIFKNGRNIKTIYNYVYNTGYTAMNRDTAENMCVYILKYRRGACYQRAALLSYMLSRAGYETYRVYDGYNKSTSSPHNWVIVKTDEGWRHIDATPFRYMKSPYLVKDSAVSPYFSWDTKKYPKCV